MEVVSTNEKQTVTKAEAPNEDALTYKGWGEPATKRAKVTWDILQPTNEIKFYTDRAWDPDTETQKKSAELLAAYEKDRVFVKDGTVYYRSDLKTYCLFRGSFFDSRWYRSVYWDKRTRQFESRATCREGCEPEPVVWTAPDDWTVETRAEFDERSKHWNKDGLRLEHEHAVAGAKHQLYEHPDHPVVRIVAVNGGDLPPKVLVKHEETNRAWWLFTDELDTTVINTRRNIKNWQKRRRTSYRISGKSVWDTVTVLDAPPDKFERPLYPIPLSKDYPFNLAQA